MGIVEVLYILYMDINIYNLIYKLFTAFPFSVLNIMETMQALSLVSCNSLIPASHFAIVLVCL